MSENQDKQIKRVETLEIQMQVKDGNLLDVTEGIIAHQVNCFGVMGAGVALAIKETYPAAFDDYDKYCQLGKSLLGGIQVIQATDQLKVINVFGQISLGTRTRQTSYDATDEAWEVIGKLFGDQTIHIPYMMGCGLGGGNREIYKAILNRHHNDVVAMKI